MAIKLRVNGKSHTLDIDPDTPLLWVLRDTLGLTGTKFGCGIAQCGACTVHVDGEARRACVTPLKAVAGRAITTIEGLVLHEPPVVGGADGHGAAPQRCEACHQPQNVGHARVPGHPNWHLAPAEMGWIDQSLAAICEQIKDPELNGGLTLEALHEHMAHDTLVGWAWSPGQGREPAPGSQVGFARLIRAWIDSGAHCPDGEAGASTGPSPPADSSCGHCHGS